MKQVPLRNREGVVIAHALVDDEDYDWLMQWRWHVQRKSAYHHTPYAARSEHVSWDNARQRQRVRSVQMHVQIMGRPGVDHRDGNGLNNQRSNLRLATQRQNGQNRRARRATKTGIRGVTPQSNGNGYLARAQVGNVKWCRWFKTIEEATEAVVAFRAEHMPFSEEEARSGP